MVYHNWLVVWNMTFIFHFINGMSSFPLTNNSYFSRWLLHHQAAIHLMKNVCLESCDVAFHQAIFENLPVIPMIPMIPMIWALVTNKYHMNRYTVCTKYKVYINVY